MVTVNKWYILLAIYIAFVVVMITHEIQKALFAAGVFLSFASYFGFMNRKKEEE